MTVSVKGIVTSVALAATVVVTKTGMVVIGFSVGSGTEKVTIVVMISVDSGEESPAGLQRTLVSYSILNNYLPLGIGDSCWCKTGLSR